MPWSTPTLRDVRQIIRDDITAAVTGVSLLGNSVLRVMADANAGLTHLTLRYIDWLARQLLPDTAETEWLDRHGDIWLTNSDNSVGRKGATYAKGVATFTGSNGTVMAAGVVLNGEGVNDAGNVVSVGYETTEQIVIGIGPTPCDIIAVDAGVAGNVLIGSNLSLLLPVAGVDNIAIVTSIDGGTEEENDDDLRTRVLLRIREPPMGGDATDYIQWTLAIPGVTRAWSYPKEMGIGTCTVRFMMDDLRAGDDGIPSPPDVAMVKSVLDTQRPVAVKDFFVEAPIPYSINFTIGSLSADDESTRAAIELSVREMFRIRVIPGVTLWRSWLDEAISSAIGEDSHELDYITTPMPSPGFMATLGVITYV